MPIVALTRLVMKPGDSRTSTVSLPIRRATSVTAAIVSSALSSACTISTSLILCTGLKKCMPATRAGLFSDPAISVMLSADVLVASTARGGASRSTSANSWIFRSIRSGAASITKSVSPSAASRLLVVRSRSIIGPASDAGTFPRSTPFATIASMTARAFSRAGSATSYSRVSKPPAIAA